MAEFNTPQIGYSLHINGEYYNTLDIEGFSQMMKDPSYCYKFYWLEAIVDIISEGIQDTTFDAIIDEMLCNAWYSIQRWRSLINSDWISSRRRGKILAIISVPEILSYQS